MLIDNELVHVVIGLSTGTGPFEFTCLLHTYFLLPDVANTTISGLGGLHYVDKVNILR